MSTQRQQRGSGRGGSGSGGAPGSNGMAAAAGSSSLSLSGADPACKDVAARMRREHPESRRRVFREPGGQLIPNPSAENEREHV